MGGEKMGDKREVEGIAKVKDKLAIFIVPIKMGDNERDEHQIEENNWDGKAEGNFHDGAGIAFCRCRCCATFIGCFRVGPFKGPNSVLLLHFHIHWVYVQNAKGQIVQPFP
jgi:hypothetical protein